MATKLPFETHGRIDVFRVDPDDLKVDPTMRGRFAEPDIGPMMESIKIQGQLEPILARKAADGSVWIAAGFTRHAAISELKKQEPAKGWTVLVRVLSGINDADGFAMTMAENLVRNNLSPLEAAQGVKTLRQVYGKDPSIVASSLGKSVPWVYQMEKITALPADLQRHVHVRDVSVEAALDLAGKPDYKKILKELLIGKISALAPGGKRARVTKKDVASSGPSKRKIIKSLNTIDLNLYLRVENIIDFIEGHTTLQDLCGSTVEMETDSVD